MKLFKYAFYMVFIAAFLFPASGFCRPHSEAVRANSAEIDTDAAVGTSEDLMAATLPDGQIPAGPKAYFGPIHKLSPAFFGTNIENAYVPNVLWSDPDVKQTIIEDGFQNLRFPGGDFGNYYNWKSGWIWSNLAQWGCSSGSGRSLNDSIGGFANLIQETNAFPLYLLNVVTEDITNPQGAFITPALSEKNLHLAQNNQIAMLKNASAQGLSVPFVELGNELYWDGASGCPGDDMNYASGTRYGNQMNSWVAAVRAAYPEAQIAAVGALPPGDAKLNTWNSQVLDHIKGINALTLHRYDETTWDPVAADNLAIAFTDWSAIQKNVLPELDAKGLQAWFTEFGGFTDDTGSLKANGTWKTPPAFTGTWLLGLYDSLMAVQFLSDPRVGQISFYNLTDAYFQTVDQPYWEAGNPPSGCNSCPTGGSVSLDNKQAGGLTGIGQAYNLVGRAINGAAAAYQTSFPTLPWVKVSPPNQDDVSSYPSVTGVWLEQRVAASSPVATNDDLFSDANKSGVWLILNLSSKQQMLPFSDRGLGTIESLWSPSLMTVVNSDTSLNHQITKFGGGSAIDLPPYSVNLITTYKSDSQP